MPTRRFLAMLPALLALLLASLACEFSVSTANIANATLSKTKDNPVKTSVFGAKDTIYCVLEVKNAPDDTKLKAVWKVVSVQGEDPGTQILDKEITTGSESVYFSLSNDNPWPVGKYAVEIYLNDKLDRTLEFEVK